MDATTDAGAGSRLVSARWARTAAFGLGLVGLALLVSSGHLLAVDALRGPVVILPVLGTLALVAAAMAGRATRRGVVVALVVGSLLLLGNLGHLVDTLTLPASPWDFIPNLAAGVGLVVGLVAAVASLRDRRTTEAVQRRVTGVALSVVAIGSLASIVLAGSVSTAVPDAAVVVDTLENRFDPVEVAAVPGDVLAVRNLDPYGHTFTVEALDINVGVAGDATESVELAAATAPGTYEVTCVLHPVIMVGTLTVEEPVGEPVE